MSQKDTAQAYRVEQDNQKYTGQQQRRVEQGTQDHARDKGYSRTDRATTGSNRMAAALTPREKQCGLVDQSYHMQPDGGRIVHNLRHVRVQSTEVEIPTRETYMHCASPSFLPSFGRISHEP